MTSSVCLQTVCCRGRWHSSDVAVKIMSCNRDELPKMLKEAEVMMQLNHLNIVRAFHASVWNPAEQSRALKVSRWAVMPSVALCADVLVMLVMKLT